MIHIKATLLAAALLLLALPNAQAEEKRESLSERLVNCRAIDSALERLDCYDQVTRNLNADAAGHDISLRRGDRGEDAREQAQQRAQEQRDRAESQRSEAREQASSNFGREHRNQRTDEDVRYVEIIESWQGPRGLWRFRMADGAEWHQTQSGHFQFDEDETYFIRRGVLNSFMLGQESNNRSIRVRRVD